MLARETYLTECQRLDPHGCYTDREFVAEFGVAPLTLAESWECLANLYSEDFALYRYRWQTSRITHCGKVAEQCDHCGRITDDYEIRSIQDGACDERAMELICEECRI